MTTTILTVFWIWNGYRSVVSMTTQEYKTIAACNSAGNTIRVSAPPRSEITFVCTDKFTGAPAQ